MKKSAFHKVDQAGGRGFLLLPRSLLESEAYQTLSFRAKAALTILHLRFNGFNNGQIALSSRDMAAALSKSQAQNLAALQELEEHGIIALETDFPKVQRKAREYRLTFVSSGPERSVRPATNDYLTYTCKKSPARTVRAARSFPARTVRADAKGSALTVRADEAETANLSNLSARTVPTHISSHTSAISADPLNTLETAGGHFRAEPIKPQSMTGERWDMAVKRARENPSAPDAEPLRAKAADAIARIGRGTQRRIANAAGLSEPVMSKFMRGTTDLDGGQRIRIAQSIPALFAHRSDAA